MDGIGKIVIICVYEHLCMSSAISLSLSAEVIGAIPLFYKFHVGGFSKLIPKSIQSVGKRFFPKRYVKASLTRRRLTTTVYFLDGRFKKIEYDMSTTVDGVEAHLTKNYAMQQFLGVLRALPNGNSIFFNVSKIHDSIGFLPEQVILGINKRAIHFYRPVLMECLQPAKLKDIAHCERKNAILSSKIYFSSELNREKKLVKLLKHLLVMREKQEQQEKMQEELDRLRLLYNEKDETCSL